MLNRMSLNMRLSTRTLKGILLICLMLAVLMLFSYAILRVPVPRIDTKFSGASIDISADRGWSLLPADCVTIQWEVEGIKSIYIDNRGKPGWGEMPFCPATDTTILEIGITAQDGSRRIFHLVFYYLPTFILYLLGFAGVAFAGFLALYYFLNHHLDKPAPLWGMTFAVLALILIGGLLQLFNDVLIKDSLSLLASLFAHPYWHVFGIILAGLIYLPLAVQALRHDLKNKSKSDLIVIGSFFVFILLLYLPFGFKSIGHWEEWVIHAYLEGRPSKAATELVGRFWGMVPHTLAYIISSESFLGYHLVNFAMFWGKLVLLYGILRQLKIAPLYAFLMTMLFMVYPVNVGLMSLRSMPMQFSTISLLAAVYLMLDYQKHPTHLRLLGICLGLIFNIASSESAYVIILAVPLLWCLRGRKLTRMNFNLTAIWYTFPAAKVAYLLLLLSANQSFYRDEVFNISLDSPEVLSDVFSMVAYNMADVYRHTFLDGWREAWTAAGQNTYMILAVAMLALAGGVAWHLLRVKSTDTFPSVKQIGIWLTSGLLLIILAVGVLVWIERYSGDPWRMYFYVPIGAAMTMFALIVLLTLPLAKSRYRDAAMIILCLILMLPASSRLILQHEHFVDAANIKARVLASIMEQAPQIDPAAKVILLTDMSLEDLQARHIAEFRSNMLDSAFYVLYQDARPQFALMCRINQYIRCHIDDIELTEFPLQQDTDYRDTVLLRLYHDGSVKLLHELPKELGAVGSSDYDPKRLYNLDAPLPPRAATMLGSALRG